MEDLRRCTRIAPSLVVADFMKNTTPETIRTKTKPVLILGSALLCITCFAQSTLQRQIPTTSGLARQILSKETAIEMRDLLGVDTNGVAPNLATNAAMTVVHDATNNLGSAAFRNVSDFGSPIVEMKSIWQFGARGVTNDDTAALQAAAASGAKVIFSNAVFTSGPIVFSNNTIFEGINSLIRFRDSDTNASLFTISNVSGVCLSGLYLDGGYYTTYDPSTGESLRTNLNRTALSVDSASDSRFTTCTVKGFDTAVLPFGTETSASAYLTDKPMFRQLTVCSNGYGFFINSTDASHVVEYFSVIGNQIRDNSVGVYLRAANVMVSENHINHNGYAVSADGTGPNGCHSELSDNTINHNVQPLWVSSVSDALFVHGNTFYANVGAIHLANCQYVAITGNVFSETQWGVVNGSTSSADANGPNYVERNYYKGTYGTVDFRVYDYWTGNGIMTSTNRIIHRDNTSITVPGDSDGTFAYAAGGTNFLFPHLSGTNVTWSTKE